MILLHHQMPDAKKFIVAQWVRCSPDSFNTWGYTTEMRVVESTHPNYTIGTRFDFGFNYIAIEQGYTVIQLPLHPDKGNL